MKAIQLEKSYAKFAGALVANKLRGHGSSMSSMPLRLSELNEFSLPGDEWTYIYPIMSGICGSDIKTIQAKSSRMLEHLVSFPFVPGHETVAIRADNNKRVVVESLLSCKALNIDSCEFCKQDLIDKCQCQEFSSIAPGLQIGFTKDIPGGWSEFSMAHSDQLYEIPDDMSDEDAVLVEPMACAIHGVLKIQREMLNTFNDIPLVAVIGAGTLGLCTTAALRHFYKDSIKILTSTKYPYQRKLAKICGSDYHSNTQNYLTTVRHLTGSFITGPALTYGADVVIDCVGSKESLHAAITTVKPGGQIVLTGMPSKANLDLSLLWQRQITLTGAYTYSTEVSHLNNANNAKTFELAINASKEMGLGRLVSAKYSLDNYEAAIEHAIDAGKRDSTKIVFTNNKADLIKKLQRRIQ